MFSSSAKPSQRGRAAPSTTRQAAASSATGSRTHLAASSSKPSASATTRTLNQSNATRTGTKPPRATPAQLTQSRSRPEPSAPVRATTTLKPSGAASVSASKAGSSVLKPRPRAPEAAPRPAVPDALQLAAQSCAWSYMTSTLEEELVFSRSAAHAALQQRQKELDEEEADIAESRVRYEAERLLQFYDELSDVKIAEAVAEMIVRFQAAERSIRGSTAQALQLTSLPLDDTTDIAQYTRLLDTLDALETECQELSTTVQRLSSMVASADARLPMLFGNLGSILRGYEENVACAKSLAQSCRENYRMGIGTLTLG
ncbi:hypothetical protein PYCCODRAFT_1476093 [Trametes coccinea BRFM310]|uniref:Uncharacterized protein n=1 Tax=Trametes coccinea (strain BRFM310) TaxID=1353009 RepID=A0A1Y2ITV1_TRAC3|nr:hypothetical protein PYCCODRAFT_1476093 [Trametes coccinea BRFM310]